MKAIDTPLKKKRFFYAILIILALFIIIGFVFSSPINQDPEYHNFSDKNTILGIPNFWNVFSNLPFLVIGGYALFSLRLWGKEKIQYFMFFTGIVLASFGSAYYHWSPTDDTLVWDRLPMTISFMSIFSIIISEFIDELMGRKILIPALFAGIFSIMYWVYFDDLRIYALVQFLPLIIIPIIIIFYKSRYNRVSAYWILLFAYILAKLFEYFDYEIHDILTILSGHTMKHLTAALGICILMMAYIKREKIS